MLKKLLEIFNLKFFFFFLVLVVPFQNLSLADNIQNFQIEGMSIGDSALNYFNETQLEDNEQGWHNYSYNEYSTSFMPGKGIYDWFLVSYKSDDYNYKIEALVGGLKKTNYDNKECDNEINAIALNVSKLFKNTKQENKKTYELLTGASRKYPFTGKSIVTSVSFDFPDDGKIILSCYNVDKETKKNANFITSTLNLHDSFRINVRSRLFVDYLKKKE
jgi:hypothetical protein|tara:strand:- start:2400 stop:3053 length:654 start_codon:yes stop_codon:yes gene_type:complete